MLKRFFFVSRLEAWSFILLLGIAMPLKYIFDWPYAVKYLGWAHGVLFILYFYLLLRLKLSKIFTWTDSIFGALASLLPFGPFIFEANWRKRNPEN